MLTNKTYAVGPIAKAVYFIEGDEKAFEYQSMVVDYENTPWLVATWLQSNDTGALFPDRIIPLASLPHFVEANGMIRLGMLMPKQLLSADASQDILDKYGAEIYPMLSHNREQKPDHLN